jgi:hypothetical protein
MSFSKYDKRFSELYQITILKNQNEIKNILQKYKKEKYEFDVLTDEIKQYFNFIIIISLDEFPYPNLLNPSLDLCMNIEIDDKRLLCYNYFEPYNISENNFGEMLYYGLIRKYFGTSVLNNFRY